MNPFLVSGLRGLAALALAALPLSTLAATETFYIHVDHLDTPRLITDGNQDIRWRWDNDDPFGGNMANANPSGLGTFEFNLRFPGQYFDRETNQHYNYFRNYSPEIGRYIESDPIGLEGGMNTYSYAGGDPVNKFDLTGLKVEVRCRTVGDPYNPGFRAGAAATLGGEHCYVVVSCPLMTETTISYLGPINIAPRGGSHNNDTIYSGLGRYRPLPVIPPSGGGSNQGNCADCKFEQCILTTAMLLQYFGYRVQNYGIWGPNSNSFTRRLVESCGGSVTGSGPLTGWGDASRVGF